MADDLYGDEIYTLTDEDGNENQFELIGNREIDGSTYLALVPIDDNEEEEYVILKVELDDDGEESLVTINDDDEFDRVADIFDDELFGTVDYDDDI
ncbi:MAG: DUF1292 domain-containing protein [Eubacteriales bacterium]|nr:DUF1292 domain-containing protein [Eubacteriales bacterium]